MPQFDDMFKKFFDQNEFPNPFDPEGFGRFIQEQIKSAMPENVEGMTQPQSGSGQTVDYSAQPQRNTMNLPTTGSKKGTNSGMGRPSNQQAQGTRAQTAQAGPTQEQQELNYQAFETHDDFIIRVEIVEDEALHPKNIALNSTQVTFLNGEATKPLLHIQLPKPVQPDQIKAGFRQGILEIKLPKKEEEGLIRVDLSDMYKPKEEANEEAKDKQREEDIK